MSSFKGVDTLEALVNLLKDPVALENTLTTIRQATRAYEEAIENVTELSKVDQYIQEVTKARTEIAVQKKAADEQAEAIVRQATLRADEMKIKANAERQEIAKRLEEITQKQAYVDKQALDIQARLREVHSKEEAVKKQAAELAKLQQELEARKQKLLAAIQ